MAISTRSLSHDVPVVEVCEGADGKADQQISDHDDDEAFQRAPALVGYRSVDAEQVGKTYRNCEGRALRQGHIQVAQRWQDDADSLRQDHDPQRFAVPET